MTIDIFLMSAFLGCSFILGLLASRKTRTLQEYGIGTKNFSTATIATSISTTGIGILCLLYALNIIGTKGLPFIMSLLIYNLCLLITGQVLMGRIGKFINKLSVAEFMYEMYGPVIRIITAVGGIIKTIAIVIMQFQIIKLTINLILELEETNATILSAIIIMLCAIFSGLRFIGMMSLFQLYLFAIVIPIVAFIIWESLKDTETVNSVVTPGYLLNWENFTGTNFDTFSMLSMIFYCLIPPMHPVGFQHTIMARDIEQSKKSFTYAAIVGMFITTLIILSLTRTSSFDLGYFIKYIRNNYEHYGFISLIAMSIISIAMTTASAHINATTVLIVNDLLPSFNYNSEKLLRITILFSVLTGIMALSIAINVRDLLQLIILASNFYMPIITAPLLLSMLGFRSTSKLVLIGMSVSFVTGTSWSLLFNNSGSIFPSTVVSLLFHMSSHYICSGRRNKQGSLKVYDTIVIDRLKWVITRWEKYKHLLDWTLLYDYLKENTPKKALAYSVFNVYIIGVSYTSLVSILATDYASSQKLTYDFIVWSTLLSGVVVLMYPIYPKSFKTGIFMTFAWPIITGYMLFFVGGTLVIMSHFHRVQVMIFMLNLIISSLLFSWPLLLLLFIAGIMGTKLMFFEHDIYAVEFKISYIVFLLTSCVIAIIRFRQIKKKLHKKHAYLLDNYKAMSDELVQVLSHEERFIKALDIEGIDELQKTVELGKELQKKIHQIAPNLLTQELENSLITFKNRLSSTAQYLGILAHRATTYLRLEVGTTSIKSLLYDVLDFLVLENLTNIPQVTFKKRTKSKYIECDTDKIKKLLLNAILYMQAQNSTNKAIISISVTDATLGYAMNSLQGYMKKVPAFHFTVTDASQLPDIEEVYLSTMEQTSLDIPLDRNSLLMLSNQRTLQAHYGYMAIKITDKVVTQVYVIPQQIRDVRPKEMDIPEMEPDAELEHSDENYPGAIEQEENFLNAIKINDLSDLEMIHKAIRLIKKYHGPVKRKSGEPFYLHPLEVAKIVLDYTYDVNTILGALLHDIVEDTSLTLPQIELMFNPQVKKIVDGVTHLDSRKTTMYKLKLAAHENIRQLLEVEDKHVLYVKLADRTHNMRTIQFHSSLAKRKVIAEETLQFFVPAAQYLGLAKAAEELKVLSSRVLNQES